MEFEINKERWAIIEIDNDKMNEIEGNEDRNVFIHGTTRYNENAIYINEGTPSKRRTLIHELTHCFMYMYGHNQERKYSNEEICEISASSHDIIHKIVEDYFKEGEKIRN